jgi:hypothetical protein
MVTFVAHISVAEVAAIMNAIIAAIQQTFGLAFVIILIYALHNVNSALSWSVITRSIHSSLWPTLLRTDSASSINTSFRISLISILGFASTVLIMIASVITPLGLRNGPILQSGSQLMKASYIPDTSPIGLATSPRDHFAYSRLCGAVNLVPCPGNGHDANATVIAPSIRNIFSSTNHGTFDMQFRRYYQGTGGYNYSMSRSQYTMLQSFILRDDIFAVDGLIVDFTMNTGIGLWNHTMPTLEHGGGWSHDMLWLEPVTSCVNTNLTIDYTLTGSSLTSSIDTYNLTDQGGLVNLTADYPKFSRDGQHTDIRAHAYKAAVLGNLDVLRYLNITRNESHIGRTFPLNDSQTNFMAGTMQHLTLGAVSNAENVNASAANTTGIISGLNLDILCKGYGGQDTANITHIGVHCGMLLGPPERTDGGNPRLPAANSTWRQSLHACASVTQARLQNVQFSFNGTLGLGSLHISRQNTNAPVLWAVENTTLSIDNVDIFWGHIADSFQDDPSIDTMYSETFYLPAGSSDILGLPAAGQPSTILSSTWSTVYGGFLADLNLDAEYSGQSNIALLTKWQSLLSVDPVNGPARIHNLIWTDWVANMLVGTDTANNFSVAVNEPSLSYDFRYSIPALLSLVIWVPMFFAAVVILLTSTLKIRHMRHLLNQTSVGRIIVGDSVLSARNGPAALPETRRGVTGHLETSCWAKTTGATHVVFDVPGPRTLKEESLSGSSERRDQNGEGAGSTGALHENVGEVYSTKKLTMALLDFERSGQQ